MGITLSREKLCAVTGGSALPTTEKHTFHNVEYDSRNVRGGELFVALKGELSHGHAYMAQAFKSGAALFLVEDPAVRDGFPEPERVIVVPDTLQAFSTLANWWRKELRTPIVAITGSVGKTTTKEATAHILLAHSNGAYSRKSHNNHVGLPYSLCQISRDHAWAVVELGMNHPGEIDRLAQLAEPDVGLITGIAVAHLEAFESVGAIADAKCELASRIRRDGALALNADDPILLDAVARVKDKLPANVLTFGVREQADVRILKVASRGLEGIAIDFSVFGTPVSAEIPVLGKHNARNIAASVLAAKLLVPDLSIDQIRSALSTLRTPDMRLTIHPLSGGRSIIDDSYNANPASMRAMIDLARDLIASGKRVGLILGHMRELGPTSESFHREVGSYAAAIGPQFVIGVGPFAEQFVDPAKSAGVPAFLSESPEVAAHTALKLPFDVVAIKGSRGVELDRAVKLMLEKQGTN